jgi:hypothetical protein
MVQDQLHFNEARELSDNELMSLIPQERVNFRQVKYNCDAMIRPHALMVYVMHKFAD